ncbi:MAG: putative baseplate assembly protein [Cyanobacteria bacterium P01_G01_bin.67]
MKNSFLSCQNEQRRRLILNQNNPNENNLNGLDYLQVSEDQLTLKVYLMRKEKKYQENQELDSKDISITSINGDKIEVNSLHYIPSGNDKTDDWLEVKVNRRGNFSQYILKILQNDEDKNSPLKLDDNFFFDPRYAQLQFSFKVNCPSDLDCKPRDVCPPEELSIPEIDYLAKDYRSFRRLILDRMSLLVPEWQERHVPDLGLTLVEILAYTGDHLSYFQDAVATEAYLQTARQRISVRRHARLVDYTLHEGCNARTWVCLEVSEEESRPVKVKLKDLYFIAGDGVIDKNKQSVTQQELLDLIATGAIIFEPVVGKFFDDNPPSGDEEPRNSEPDEETTSNSSFEIVSEYYSCDDNETDDSESDSTEAVRHEEDGNNLDENGADESELSNTDSDQNKENSDLEKQQEIEEFRGRHWWQDEEIYLWKGHNKILFYTWGNRECCLPKGATSATLKNEPFLYLKVGDILIFEEVKDPKTGSANPNPNHRHAVRLIDVNPSIDPLRNHPIVEIEWAKEDALPFPICISAVSQESCKLIEDISLARGNVVLVDHGLTITKEYLGKVKKKEIQSSTFQCEGESQFSDYIEEPEQFKPILPRGPLTFAEPLPFQQISNFRGKISSLLHQDTHHTLPQIKLSGKKRLNLEMEGNDWWNPKYDLIYSDESDRNFVVEIDDRNQAYLRFGNGKLGQLPAVGLSFDATYRIGNGPSGNVGAETIKYVKYKENDTEKPLLTPYNPFPAQGGKSPETIAEAKLFAPQEFRRRLERAITTKDYENIILREFENEVQRVKATIIWTGSWYEVLIAIDQFGQVEAETTLLEKIKQRMIRYRRMGHDIRVKSAVTVPLDIAMTVCVLPRFLRGSIKAELLDLFSDRILPDGRRGAFHPDNLTFGTDIRLSSLVALAMTVTGVENVRITKLERLLEGSNQEINNGILPIGPLEVPRLDNDFSFPENGRFVLEMRGGR